MGNLLVKCYLCFILCCLGLPYLYFPRSKHLLCTTISSDFAAQENKIYYYFQFFFFYLPCSDGTRSHDLSFFVFLFSLMLSFKPTLPLSYFTFIKRLFISSSLSAIKMILSSYLRWLTFLPAILISACGSSSPSFLMMHSAYVWDNCEQVLGVGDGQGSLACWVTKIWAWLSNWTELNSAYKLNEHGDNIQSWYSPFPNWTSVLFHVLF